MSQPAGDPRQLDPAQARRLLGGLSLRPGEQILCLGPDGGALAGVAAILVGPTGRIVDADPTAVTADTPLPHPDDEFDAVILDLTTPHPNQTHLLTEAARITAPTGRVAYAVPHRPDGNPAPVQQLAETAGLRGVATRPDPGGEPVEFVTAFPPPPAGMADDTPTTEFHLPKSASQPAQPAQSRRRSRLLIAAAALVVAAAAGVAWAVAVADPGDDAPGSGSDPLAGDTELDIDQLGAEGQPAADQPPAGGGLPTDNSDTDSSSDTGTGSESAGSSGSGGGQPSNRPPVIESAGLTSEGLVLAIGPQVTDPEDDEVTLLFDVNGTVVDPAQTADPTTAKVFLNFADVGYRSDVPVTIIATDSRGATTRETYSHEVTARTEVTLPDLELTFNDQNACFSAWNGKVSFQLDLTGAIEDRLRLNGAERETHPVYLTGGFVEFYVGEEPPPLQVSLSVTLSGIGSLVFAAPKTYTSDADVSMNAFTGTPCEGKLTYRVSFSIS